MSIVKLINLPMIETEFKVIQLYLNSKPILLADQQI